MPPRRALTVLTLAALAAGAAVAATLPWSVGTPLAAAFVSRGLHDYGLSLTAEGSTAMTLLPLPRLSFSRVRVAASQAGGPALVEGGSLVLELNPLALLSGQADIGSVILDGATFHLPRGAEDARWKEPIRHIRQRLSPGGSVHPRRLVLTRATLESPDERFAAQDVGLTMAWPLWSATLDAAASLTWRGARTDLTLAGLRTTDLVNGGASPFSVSAAWPAGRLHGEGTARNDAGVALSGQGGIEIASLPETLAWLRGSIALAPFVGALSLDGRFETSGGMVSLPTVRVTTGSDVLEGAGSVNLGGDRVSVQATLAAERLNLAPLLGRLVGMFGRGPGDAGAGTASPSIALAPLTGGDLDLRISAGESRIGPILMDDLAASILVRQDAVEVSLGRAGFRNGTLKGRLSLAASGVDGLETEVKTQGTFDRIDVGGLLVEFGESRWLLGGTQGQFAIESTGRDVADLTARVAGRATFAIDGGMISGLDLADVMHRNGAVATGALARRNGRTPFERVALSLKFADGVGEIDDAVLKAANLNGTLRGQVSLPARSVRARAEIGGRGAGTSFEIAGPWDSISVRKIQNGTEFNAPFSSETVPAYVP